MTEIDTEIANQVKTLLEADLVLVDFEATSSSKDPDVSIVQVGVLGRQGNILLESYVRPGRKISEAAEDVHGLDNQDVASAPSFDKLYPELKKHLAGRQILTYNAEADQRILQATCERFDLPVIEAGQWHDLMRLYTHYRKSERTFKLTEACQQEGVDVENAHRAVDDCRLALALAKKMASRAGG